MHTIANLRSLASRATPPLLVTALFLTLYQFFPDRIWPSDATWAPHVVASAIYDRDLYLDEYRTWMPAYQYFAVHELDGHLVSYFPVAGPLLTIPSMLVLDAVMPALRDTTIQAYLIGHPPYDPVVYSLHLTNASLLMALSAAIMYLIGRTYVRSPYALLLAAAYALGTSAYSTASRALWQHGPSMLLLSLTLLMLVRARQRPALVAFVALPLGLAYAVRPTNSISVVVISLYVLLTYRSYFLRYMLLGLLVALLFAGLNLAVYHAVLPPYFSATRLGSATFGEALLGNLVSPSRGVFIYSPILLLVPVGIFLKVRHGQCESIDWALAAIIVLHWIVISAFPHWWAGYSFGPRFFADVMPYAVYFLIPVLSRAQTGTRRAYALTGVYILLLLPSIAIHAYGGTSRAVWGWNNTPADIAEQPGRLWDWGDAQVLRGLGSRLLAITPETLTVDMAANPAKLALQFGGATEGLLDVTLYLPARVTLDPESAELFNMNPLAGSGQVGSLREPISAIELIHLDLLVDTTNLSHAQALPAIQLIAREETGQQETVVIPLVTGDAAEGQPSDVVVQCAPGRGRLATYLGPGWHDEEMAGDATWRWASSPAYLFVRVDRRQSLTVTLAVSNLHDAGAPDGLGQAGVMNVSLPDGQSMTVTAQSGQPLSVPADVEKGWNTFLFELEAGNFRPSDLTPGHFDTRELSFALDEIVVAGACAVPAP